MESNGVEAARIRQEIDSLKSNKRNIEQRISALEAQLHQLEVNSSAVCTSLLSNGDLGSSNGLSPDMIYRYSRHLLLPSFGVQGSVRFNCSEHS